MRIEPQVPTAEDAVQHFRDMAHGRLPKDTRQTRHKRRLFGGWGGNGATFMKTTLVTPTAMALEQAKSELRQKGERIPRKKQSTKRTTKKTKGGGGGETKKAKVKSAIKGRKQQKRLQSAVGPRQVKTHKAKAWSK